MSDAQHGFLRHSTYSVGDLAKGLDDQSQTYLILLDYDENACNEASRQCLLMKVEHYGVRARGSTLNWIRDFLNNRTQ